MNLFLVYGIGAILLWSTLASAGNFLKAVPPLLLLSLCLGIAGLPALLNLRQALKSKKFLLLGQFGYFAYHLCLFLSFRFISPVKANLINYLWPMFLILFSSLVFKEFKLKLNHLAGALLSFSGCAWIILSGPGQEQPEHWIGYLLAFLPAIIWPLFSLLAKRLGDINFWQICGACLVSGILCFPIHFAWETSYSLSLSEWMAIAYIGLGPMALGFYWWEKAMKAEGQLLGLISYITPFLSTSLLLLTTGGSFHTSILVAVALILSGSLMGVADKFQKTTYLD